MMPFHKVLAREGRDTCKNKLTTLRTTALRSVTLLQLMIALGQHFRRQVLFKILYNFASDGAVAVM